MKIFNLKNIKVINVSHIRCDGTVNVFIQFNDETEIEFFGLKPKQAYQLESSRGEDQEISYDEKLLFQTEKQWLRQNGIEA